MKIITLLLLIISAPAYAYVGPGPGLSMLGSLWTLLVGILLAIFMVIYYPLRLLWKKYKNKTSIKKQPHD